MRKAKVLFVDIETSPMEVFAWGLGEQYVGMEQIIKEWTILCWCAKWLDGDELFFESTKNQTDKRNDKSILKGIWKLLDEADVIITQNGRQFDEKKLNTRFLLNKMQPPSRYKHVDTLQIAKSKFAFTSNKLAYTTDTLNDKYKKLSHKDFPGLELWKECLKGNKKAWLEMEKYNKHDVLALEEYYKKLQPWDNSINFSVYEDENHQTKCNCGSTDIVRNGFHYSATGKYQRYKCAKCGSELRDRATKSNNRLSLAKQKSLKALK